MPGAPPHPAAPPAQETLKRLSSQLEVYEAQLEAQRLETRAAQELLAQAEAEMESVHFEKKQLVARWKSSLNAVARWAGGPWPAPRLPGASGPPCSMCAGPVRACGRSGVLGAAGPAEGGPALAPERRCPGWCRRDEALQAVQAALREQQEQEVAVAAEISGYRKDVAREQQRNEQLTGVLRRAEGGLARCAALRCAAGPPRGSQAQLLPGGLLCSRRPGGSAA
jgi:hypothetical protein